MWARQKKKNVSQNVYIYKKLGLILFLLCWRKLSLVKGERNKIKIEKGKRVFYFVRQIERLFAAKQTCTHRSAQKRKKKKKKRASWKAKQHLMSCWISILLFVIDWKERRRHRHTLSSFFLSLSHLMSTVYWANLRVSIVQSRLLPPYVYFLLLSRVSNQKRVWHSHRFYHRVWMVKKIKRCFSSIHSWKIKINEDPIEFWWRSQSILIKRFVAHFFLNPGNNSFRVINEAHTKISQVQKSLGSVENYTDGIRLTISFLATPRNQFTSFFVFVVCVLYIDLFIFFCFFPFI